MTRNLVAVFAGEELRSVARPSQICPVSVSSLLAWLWLINSLKMKRVLLTSTNRFHSFVQFPISFDGTNAIAGLAGTWKVLLELLSIQQHCISHVFWDGYCASCFWGLLGSIGDKCFPSCSVSLDFWMSLCRMDNHLLTTNEAKHCAVYLFCQQS